MAIDPRILIDRRERAMDAADRAIEAHWPHRTGDAYIREMQAAVAELEQVAVAMREGGADSIQRSRTHRYLGTVFANLEPALGSTMFDRAAAAYREADALLEGTAVPLEQAKLDFNYADLLRLARSRDADALREAERRLLAAQLVFQAAQPELATRVTDLLGKVRTLSRLAPVVAAVETARSDLEAAEDRIASGDAKGAAGKLRDVQNRAGGPSGIVAELQALVATLPETSHADPAFSQLQSQMAGLVGLATGSAAPLDPQVAEIMKKLRERLDRDADAGTVDPDRADTLRDLLTTFTQTLEAGRTDIGSMMEQFQQMQAAVRSHLDNVKYMSHGIERPAAGSRAAKLIELWWIIRRALLEESARRGKSDAESETALKLNTRATRLDRRIYEMGADDTRTIAFEREALRPFAIEVRGFAARHHPVIARPIWSGAAVNAIPNLVVFAGSPAVQRHVAAACSELALDMRATPAGHDVASARWTQLQQANLAVFDLTASDGSERAAVAYELGIACTIGKPVVVLIGAEQDMPFDADIEPVRLTGGSNDQAAISHAIDHALVWLMPRPSRDTVAETVNDVLGTYAIPHSNPYVNQTLQLLQRLVGGAGPLDDQIDPVGVNAALRSLLTYLGDESQTLLHPVWPAAYRDTPRARIFHVMPYQPDWADAAAGSVEAACEAHGARYVRGDRVKDSDVIRSIWTEINLASHVVADLTRFSPNVALEMGIAHTLGRPTLMVGQPPTVDQLFPMVSRLRFNTYRDPVELERLVTGWLS